MCQQTQDLPQEAQQQQQQPMDLPSQSTSHLSKESSVVDYDEQPTFILAELVGACHLPPQEDEYGNPSATDDVMQPYCIVKFGERIIHKSKESSEMGLNPIWTIETQSLFLLKLATKDLTRKKLTITLWNKRNDQTLISTFSSDATFLGKVELDLATILSHCDEERFEVPILAHDALAAADGNYYSSTNGKSNHHKKHHDSNTSLLALRFRLATQADRTFVTNRNYNVLQDDISSGMSSQAKNAIRSILNGEEVETRTRPAFENITEKDETQVASSTFVNALSSFFQYNDFTEGDTGIRKIRVKPFPDPARPQQTEYLTHTDIRTETWKPSHNWVEAGSGKLGTLHLEILACHDLPNVDTGEAVGNLTDAFCCVVFEDVMVETPVIDDELSPHWLPWTQRAFKFGIIHPASMLYIGVFDYDLGITDHEAIGRVAINISNFQRDTTYYLKYNLHKSANVTDRTAHGAISVRLRIEMHDEKAALMEALKPRPKIHVNVKKEKTFSVVRYTCFGEYGNEEQFDLTVLRSYINEIFEYKMNLSYIFFDSLLSLMFWKGQVEVLGMLVPLHSFLFFCSGCILVERPYLFPSFMLLSVAWIMLACMGVQRHHPSPWMRCQSFRHYLEILLTGRSSIRTRKIVPSEGWAATQAYDKAWADRLAKDQKKRDEKYARIQEINHIGDDKISTKTNGMLIPVDLLVRLARYQGIIGGICKKFRFIKIILTWEESIISFWITVIFLTAGFVSLLFPWAFILTWTGRLVVWGLFGPHMKFVDVFLEIQAKRNDTSVEKELEKFQRQSKLARVRREHALKLKAVKEIRFGKFITNVPSFNLARHHDRPLPESSARIYCRDEAELLSEDGGTLMKNKKQAPLAWISGQQLHGSMIPRPEKVYKHNQELETEQLDRLLLFEARLAALKAAEASGGGLERIRKRVSMIRRAEEPQASGYELVCSKDEDNDDEPVFGDLCIGPYKEEPKEENAPRIVANVPKLPPKSTFSEDEASSDTESTKSCSKASEGSVPASFSSFCERVREEEGVEVVPLGHLAPVKEVASGDDTTGEDENKEASYDEGHGDETRAISFEDAEGVIHMITSKCSSDEIPGTLSMLYQESESTYVAFYRP